VKPIDSDHFVATTETNLGCTGSSVQWIQSVSQLRSNELVELSTLPKAPAESVGHGPNRGLVGNNQPKVARKVSSGTHR